MPRQPSRMLTAKAVEKLTKPGHYTAGGAPGLLLQVTPTGRKSWIVRLTMGTRPVTADSKKAPGTLVQKRIDFGLDPYPKLSLEEARKKAQVYRDMVRQGIDPREEAKAAKRAQLAKAAGNMSFRKAAEAYIDSMRAGWKNAKHADQWTNTLETYAAPIIGDMLVCDIDLPHVIAVLKQPADPKKKDSPTLWEGKTETASRVRGRIEAVLGWARVHGYRDGDNPARWKDNLDKVFPSPESVKPTEHQPALPVAGMQDFWRDLDAREGTRAQALAFAILTAVRVGRVVAARWSEIDLEAKVWTIPAELMKGRKGKSREHRVPLSESAMEVLKAQAGQHDEWVFPGSKDGKHITDAALTGLLRDMDWRDKAGAVVTTHGFRSTFRDWASEHTDYPREVAEMALAHAIRDQVEAAYRRGDLFDKRRALMADWDKFCRG